MIKIYRAVLTAISSLFLYCAAGAQTYTYTYNAAGDRTYKSGIGPEEVAGRSSAAAGSISDRTPARARTSAPAPRTLSTGSTVAGVDLSCDVGRIPVSSSVTPTGGRTYSIAIPTAAGCRLAPQSLNDITFDYILNAAVSDGRIKVPNFFNKLGFGKQGYYSAYLVIDEGSDYHWYRQDKGGKWSHKQGTTEVKNAGRRIGTPFAKYGNYKSGGISLWVKK